MKWYAKTYVGFIMAFLYLPILVLIVYSFNESKSRSYFTGFTLGWYKQLFTNDLIISSLRTTLVIALISSVFATLIGAAAAIGISNMKKLTRAVIMNFTYMPIINPEIVTGVSLMLLFGFFNTFFRWVNEWTGFNINFEFGFTTLILAHITFNIPYVILNIMPKLRQMDTSIYEAALDLGCNEWQAFVKVVVPDIMPGIIAGFLTSLTMSLDDFVISYFVSGPTSQTLPITIFSMTRRKVSPEINALSTLIFVVVLCVLLAVNIHDAQKEKSTKKRNGNTTGGAAGGMAGRTRGSAAERGAAAFTLILAVVCGAAAFSYIIGRPLAVMASAGADDYEYECTDEFYGRLSGKNISINVYNWGEYISDGSDDSLDINKAFTELTGIKVNYTTYATNEELYSKLRSGNASYDVVIPSDYMVGRLAVEGMLLPLDFDNLPNFGFIDEKFVKPLYDPHGIYSAPYTWGYVGIIYNKNRIVDGDDVWTWDILWDEKYLGDILMFSNSRDAFAIAQVRQGYSMNTVDEKELKDCLDQLKIQKQLVQAYVMDEIFDKMLGGEAALAPYYAGDALTMMSQNPDLGFAIPAEGTNLFVDAMCIPKGCRQKEAAELYINFMLEPLVGAANSEYIGYATPNAASFDLFDEDVQNDEVAYPDPSALGQTESFAPLPQDTSKLIDQLWTELLSSDEAYNKLLVPILLLTAIFLSVGLNFYRSRSKRRAHAGY